MDCKHARLVSLGTVWSVIMYSFPPLSMVPTIIGQTRSGYVGTDQTFEQWKADEASSDWERARSLEYQHRLPEAERYYRRCAAQSQSLLQRPNQRRSLGVYYRASLCQVDLARLRADAGASQNDLARDLSLAERLLTDFQSVHWAQSEELQRAGYPMFWSKEYGWKMNYLWGDVRGLQQRFTEAKRYYDAAHALNPSFVPAQALGQAIQEILEPSIARPRPAPPSHPKAQRGSSGQGGFSRAPTPHVAPPERTTPAPPPSPPYNPGVPPATSPPPPQYEAPRPALPTPGQPVPKNPCPTLMEALRETVGTGGLIGYAGSLLSLYATWLTVAETGMWGAALALGAGFLIAGGRIWSDFAQVRKRMSECDAR